MKQEEVKPTFTLTYAELMQLGDKAERLVKRDIDDLVIYGLSLNTAQSIAEQTLAFKQYPSDAELLGIVSEETKDKDKKRENVHIQISSVMIRVKNRFGMGSATYKRFSASELSNSSDEEMVHIARRVTRLATEYLPALSEKGLTQQMIDKLMADTVAFDASIDKKAAAVETRDRSTQERVMIANSLYAIITEVFDYGKDYYYTRDEAKYNDYLIYDSVSDDNSNKKTSKNNKTSEKSNPAVADDGGIPIDLF